MYVYDIETLATNETAVVLSMGVIYVDSFKPQSWETLLSNCMFIKLDSKIQVKELNRRVDASTLDWWKKQIKTVRDLSMQPSDSDLSPKEAFQTLRKFVYERTGQSKIPCYTRGFMDVIVSDHLASQVGEKMPWHYNSYRDVRTAIDILYPNSEDGYVDVNPDMCYNFDISKVLKHDPTMDVSYDAAMILYGKTE